MMEEMNEVNDFMEQFGSDFEIKWGIALDPELGKKVKVTILATGFGIKDVPEMDTHIARHTQEEEEKQTEIDIRKDGRRERYYGTGNDGGTIIMHRPHIYRFRPEELDNEEVILTVESTPTYKRTLQQVNELRRRINEGNNETVARQKEEDDSVHGTISFK